jgi:TolA-binding protein
MAQTATALQPIRPVESTISTDLQIVFGSKRKLEELSKSVVEDFRAEILRLAGSTLISATAANVDSLCNAWMQAQERYKNRSTALTTFKTELANTITFFRKNHSAELRAELQQLVDKCDEELRQRNQVDEDIVSQRTIFEGWIKELESYDGAGASDGQDASGVLAVAQKMPRKTTRKRAKNA